MYCIYHLFEQIIENEIDDQWQIKKYTTNWFWYNEAKATTPLKYYGTSKDIHWNYCYYGIKFKIYPVTVVL